MGQRQGQTSDPNFDPNYFEANEVYPMSRTILNFRG